MPVINLRDQRKAFLNGIEQSGLWQSGAKVWAKPTSYNWNNILPLNGGPNGVTSAYFRGIVTTNPDGSYRVTTAEGSTSGRALVDMPVLPAGTPIIIETSMAYNDATRLILRQVESNDSTGGLTVFDMNRPSAGAVVTRTDNFNVVTNRRFLHYIGVSAVGQYFTINPQTRWRLA